MPFCKKVYAKFSHYFIDKIKSKGNAGDRIKCTSIKDENSVISLLIKIIINFMYGEAFKCTFLKLKTHNIDGPQLSITYNINLINNN